MSWLDDYIRQQSAPPSETGLLQQLSGVVPQQQQRQEQSLLQKLTQTWPARMAQSALSAVTLPGDVYSGRVDPMSQDAINRAADLSGLIMGGTFGSAPVGAIGTGPTKPKADLITLYRGESAYNKGGNFFTPDKEWALQFTQSGRPKEVLRKTMPASKVYDPPSPVYAGNVDAVDAAIAEAKRLGLDAVRLSEGHGEPMSVFVFNKKTLR